MSHDEQDDEHVSPEVREQVVRLVPDHGHEWYSRWVTIESIAGKVG
jgi:hypothetical protein